MGRTETSHAEAVAEIETIYRSARKMLAQAMDEGRLGLLEYNRESADLERDYCIAVSRVAGRDW
jgi:hypothetical protein